MWLFHFFVNKTVSAVLKVRLNVDGTGKIHSRSASGKMRYFIAYPQVIIFLLKKYTTNEVIAKTVPEITRLVQPSYMTLFRNAEKQVKKTPWRDNKYDKYALYEIFNEGLNASIYHSIRENRESKNDSKTCLTFLSTQSPYFGCRNMI